MPVTVADVEQQWRARMQAGLQQQLEDVLRTEWQRMESECRAALEVELVKLEASLRQQVWHEVRFEF